MVEIGFWTQELVLLPMNSNMFFGYYFSNFLYFCQERLYNPRLYVLLMHLVSSRDYSREDRCNPLLLIVEVWTKLGPVVFPFTLGSFPRKNSSVWFLFPLHEFIYLFIAASCYYLFNFTQRNGIKILVFFGILWIHHNKVYLNFILLLNSRVWCEGPSTRSSSFVRRLLRSNYQFFS